MDITQIYNKTYEYSNLYTKTKYFNTNTQIWTLRSFSTTFPPPININNPKNIFLYEHTKIGADSTISTTNAKFIMKKWSGAADNLWVQDNPFEAINLINLISRLI